MQHLIKLDQRLEKLLMVLF